MRPTSPWVCRAARYRGDWSCCCRRVPQTAPESLFILGKILLLNPVAPSIPGRACLLTQPPLQLDQDCPGQGPTWPNFQLSPAGAHSLHVFTTSSLFPSLWPQATRSLSVLLKPSLAGEGGIHAAPSQESCSRPLGYRPGAAVALAPLLVPGTFLSWSNPLTVCFLSVLYTFWSPIFINAGVLLAVLFVPQ